MEPYVEIEASSIEHAVEIALEGKLAGRWDLFRGQSNSDWDVTSSAERLSTLDRAKAFERFKRFAAWAQGVEGMSAYFSDRDSLWAIAQHYGIPTFFIDFSDDPRVAAFFASDTREVPPKEQTACIVCLNSKAFTQFWKESGPVLLKGIAETQYPDLVRIDVDNLWRLQQQRGSFLWNPLLGIEGFYIFERIIFPFVERDPALPSRSEIYPIHQSELEKLLTQFFMDEQMFEGSKFIASLNTRTFNIETTIDDYEAVSWCPGGIARTSDWNQADAWRTGTVEHSSAVLPGLVIELGVVPTLEELSNSLRAMLVSDFVEFNREAPLDISIQMPSSDYQRLVRCIRRLWNGMRTLPFTSDEIAQSIVRTIELFPAVKATNADSALGTNSLYVELASNADGKGAYSRAVITREAFIKASNPEFLRAARMRIEAGNPAAASGSDAALARSYLSLPGRPWERLTFSGLRALMIEQIIPTQVAWRVGSDAVDLRTVIYFSPVGFRVLGLA
jgi:hypothetical protein